MQRGKFNLREENGITLVELLATLALMSIVLLLGGSIHMFGQKQFQAQSESASQNNDYSYALTVMSSDLRKISSQQIMEADTNIISIENSTKYEVRNNKLYQDDQTLIQDIESMKVDYDTDRISINLISSNHVAGMNNKDYQTTIYFRGEPTNEEESE